MPEIVERGKSGGVRVICFFAARRRRIYMMLAFEKSAKTSLTRAEKNELRRIARPLETED